MAVIGTRTRKNLDTVHPELRGTVARALVAAPEWLDFAVISGARSAEEQHELWLKGRDEAGMIVDQSKVVTYKDGYNRISNHQPKADGWGAAIDIVAYKDGQITWDEKEIAIRAAYIVGFAASEGIRLEGGVRWKWDYGHVERV